MNRRQKIRATMKETGETYCQVLNRWRKENPEPRKVRAQVATGDLVHARGGQWKGVEVSVRRPMRRVSDG